MWICVKSFNSQQERGEHSEFIYNSPKISIYTSVTLISISYYIYLKEESIVLWIDYSQPS